MLRWQGVPQDQPQARGIEPTHGRANRSEGRQRCDRCNDLLHLYVWTSVDGVGREWLCLPCFEQASDEDRA